MAFTGCEQPLAIEVVNIERPAPIDSCPRDPRARGRPEPNPPIGTGLVRFFHKSLGYTTADETETAGRRANMTLSRPVGF